jgi:hypothetical protein
MWLSKLHDSFLCSKAKVIHYLGYCVDGNWGRMVYVVSGVLLCMCNSEASFVHVQYGHKSLQLSLHKTASPTRWREF